MRIPNQSRLSVAVRSAVCVFIFIATIQALYWPVLPKLGMQLGWWQIDWMAQVGFYIGCIPFFLCIAMATWDLPGVVIQVLQWSVSAAWAALLFLLSGMILQWISRLVMHDDKPLGLEAMRSKQVSELLYRAVMGFVAVFCLLNALNCYAAYVINQNYFPSQSHGRNLLQAGAFTLGSILLSAECLQLRVLRLVGRKKNESA